MYLLLFTLFTVLHRTCGRRGAINNCCVPHANVEALYSCININNVNKATSTSLSTAPKPTDVALVTFLTKDILPYAAYAVAINSYYASLYNYRFVAHDPEQMHSFTTLDNYDVRWNKIGLLFDYLNSSSHSSDFVMWLDADLIIMNMNFSIQSLVSKYPNAHLIVSAG